MKTFLRCWLEEWVQQRGGFRQPFHIPCPEADHSVRPACQAPVSSSPKPTDRHFCTPRVLYSQALRRPSPVLPARRPSSPQPSPKPYGGKDAASAIGRVHQAVVENPGQRGLATRHVWFFWGRSLRPSRARYSVFLDRLYTTSTG
jgi:hypothetical protein